LSWGREDEENDHIACTSSSSERIRFFSTVAIHSIPSHSTYTKKERNRCWYSEEATDKLVTRRNKVIARMKAGKAATSKQTFRGLEHHTTKDAERVTTQIDRTIQAVIDEQDHQFSIGITDEDRIARIVRQVSHVSVADALQYAKQDEEEATAIHFGSLASDERSCSCFTEEDLASFGPSGEASKQEVVSQQERKTNKKKNKRKGRKRWHLPGVWRKDSYERNAKM
jgi:hypothetical protein